MSTIRAARLHELGRPLVVEAVELDPPDQGELAVELEYAGVNPVDTYVAAGRVGADGPLPRTLGGEAAGRRDGQPVLVAGAGLGVMRDGVWATAANVPHDAVVELPEGVGTREASAMGVAGLTAWNCVSELARVGREDRVLVLGAAGGVGSMIVSLAAAAGAQVWGQTSSEEKTGLITEQGASRALVADARSLGTGIAEFAPTIVFDPLGGEFVAPAVEAMVPRGRLVSFGTAAGGEVTFNLQSVYRKALILHGYGGLQLTQDERRSGLAAALAALARGELKVAIDEALPLERVGEAFERLGQRRVRGKLLLDLRA